MMLRKIALSLLVVIITLIHPAPLVRCGVHKNKGFTESYINLVVGENSSYVLEKELNIRKTLGNLRSSMFKVEVKYDPDKKPEKFIFYGGGFGHGVGMCQSGAYGLANLGKDYKEILNHYFSGTEFKKVY